MQSLYFAAMPRLPIALAAIFLVASGCATRRVERLTMEPLIIRVDPDGGETTVETPDPILDELIALQEEGRCDEALPRLEKFLEDFPESGRFGEAVVRLGVCHESRKEYESARGYYQWAAQRAHFELALEAALRAAWCLEEMGEPEKAAEEYRVLAGLKRAPEDARAGARLRRAINLFRAGRTKKARRELDRGIVAFSALRDPSASLRTAAAEARFAAAEAEYRAFDAIRLEYPQRRLTKRLGAKLTALAKARDAYYAVVQIKDAEWAAAAVCRVGELYEAFYGSLVSVPPPPELDDAHRLAYETEVAARAKPLRQQAFDSYLQVISLGERVGLESPWIAKSRERVIALEPLLKQNVVSPAEDSPLDEEAPPDEPQAEEDEPELAPPSQDAPPKPE